MGFGEGGDGTPRAMRTTQGGSEGFRSQKVQVMSRSTVVEAVRHYSKQTDLVFANPFEKVTDPFETRAAMQAAAIGDYAFWKHYDMIELSRIYDTTSAEYRNLKMILWEAVAFVLFLSLLTALVCVGSGTGDAFSVRQAQQQYWAGCQRPLQPFPFPAAPPACALDSVKDVSTLWKWMQNDFTSLAFPLNFTTEYSPGELADASSYTLTANSKPFHLRPLDSQQASVLLGAIRVRQVRVAAGGGCSSGSPFSHAFADCYGAYQTRTATTRTFSKKWTPTYLLDAYAYQPSDVTNQVDISGEFGTYPGGGFFFDLPPNATLARQMLSDLKEWDWVDQATRAMVIELNVLAPNVDLVANTRLLFELAPTGEVAPRVEVVANNVFMMNLRDAANGTVGAFALLVIVLAFVVAQTVHLVVLIARTRWRFFRYGWNLLDVFLNILFYVALGIRISALNTAGDKFELQPERVGDPYLFMPYSAVLGPLRTAGQVLAFCALFTWLKALKYLGLIYSMRPLLQALEKFFWEFLTFACVLVCVIFSFALALFAGFRDTSGPTSTLEGCFFSLFFLTVGKMDIQTLEMSDGRPYGTLLYLMFLLVVTFVLLNFFAAVAIDAYTLARFVQGTPGWDKRHDPMTVFLYVYYHKLRGIDLMYLHSEEFGSQQDQRIKLSLLPGLVVQRYLERRQKAANEKRHKGRRESNASSIGSSVSPSTIGGVSEEAAAMEAVNLSPEEIERLDVTRVQLQKLLDEHGELVALLGTDNAAKVIHRFRRHDPKNPTKEIEDLQERVYKKLEALEKATVGQDSGANVEALEQVRTGLSQELKTAQAGWRNQLAQVLATASKASLGLIELTRTLEAVQTNHANLVRELAAEEGD